MAVVVVTESRCMPKNEPATTINKTEEVIMSQHHEKAGEHTLQNVHHHACANLFGCGDEKGVGIFREDIKEGAFNNRASDRLLHMEEVDQANLDKYLSARGRWRRKFLQASSFMGALTAVGPWFAKLARADESGAASKPASSRADGRVHVVPSTKETVRLGVYDTNLPPILTIDSGDSINFPTRGLIFSTNCGRACLSTPWRSFG